MDLKELGWKEHFKKHFDQLNTKEYIPARVATAQREIYVLFSSFGILQAEMTGKMRFKAVSIGDLPVVGDWVIAKLLPEGGAAIIEAIIPRISKLSRKVAGEDIEEQVLGANIDIVFLVSGLDGNYNLRRIERFLTIASDSNTEPIIVLNKTDICTNLEERIAEVKAVAKGVPVITLSARNNEGIASLRKYIGKGITVAFLGSSGVGKSTIINCLLGEERLKVGAVSEMDSRGRHITTWRELIILPEGGIVIDNPGLREIQLWAEETTLENTFTDIKVLSDNCRFKDCSHVNEPDCAVRNALESGDLDSRRFENYVKLKKEIKYLATRKEKVKSRNEKIVAEKKISKLSKQIQKHKKRYEL